MIGQLTRAPYRVGDYYNDGKHEGVVFDSFDGGYHGKIIATHQNEGCWCKNSNEKDVCVSETNGNENIQKITSRYLEYNYPIYWMIKNSFGYTKRDYYLPAINELIKIRDGRNLINDTLQRIYGEELDGSTYVSSTEKDGSILTLNMYSGFVWDESKDDEFTYRLAYCS